VWDEAQEPRHILKYVEVASTAQRSDSPGDMPKPFAIKIYAGKTGDKDASVCPFFIPLQMSLAPL
jgi:hypothetical protein